MMSAWETHNLPLAVFLPCHKYRHEPFCKYQVEASCLLSAFHSVLPVELEGICLTAKIGMEDQECLVYPFGLSFCLMCP